MVNLKNEFEKAAAERGETLLSVVVGKHDRDWFTERKEAFPVLNWDQGSSFINYDYENGFGGDDCHAVIAWSAGFVFYVHEYDGATCVESMPRNPIPCDPTFSGTK